MLNSLETSLQSCVKPETLFRMQHAWLGSLGNKSIGNGVSVCVDTGRDYRSYLGVHSQNYEVQYIEDVRTLPYDVRQQSA